MRFLCCVCIHKLIHVVERTFSGDAYPFNGDERINNIGD